MADYYLGEIRAFSFGFPPKGWATCDGQLVSIAQNTALFSLLGTTYGGDGQTTFALPNLQGRAPIGAGTGPGLANYSLGQVGGTTTVGLTVGQLPAHGHQPQAVTGGGNRRDPFAIQPAAGHRWAGSDHAQYSSGTANAPMAPGIVGSVGGGAPHPNESPFLALTFCIATFGPYPSRN